MRAEGKWEDKRMKGERKEIEKAEEKETARNLELNDIRR